MERVKKSSGMLYWSGAGSAPLLETALDGTPIAEYVFFNGKRIARKDQPSNAIHFYFSDHLGSTATVTNATGTTIEEHVEYGAYGEALAGGNGPNRYLFSGKERDAGGEDYFGARYYAFRQGRFLTPDWSATPQPVPYAQLGSPQTLNLYAYVQNNPITGTDPDGHFQANQFTIRTQTSGISMEFETSDVAEIWGPEELSVDVFTYLLDGQNVRLISHQTVSVAQQQNGSAESAKASAQSAGAVSSKQIGKVWFNAYGGTAAERSAELAAMSQDLTQSDRGGAMLKALEGRKSGLFGLWGDPKPFDIVRWANPLGSYSTQGGNFIVLDPGDIGAGYRSAMGGGTYSLQRIFGHEMGHAAMGNLDNGPGAMNNVNWNENVVMRQLGDFNDRIAY